LEYARERWVVWAKMSACRMASRAVASVGERYAGLKNRYGPRYTQAMLSAAFVGLFLPVPGSCLICIGSVALIAEFHRTIGKRRGLRTLSLNAAGRRHDE